MKIFEVKNNVITNVFEVDHLEGLILPFTPMPYIEGKWIGDTYDDTQTNISDLIATTNDHTDAILDLASTISTISSDTSTSIEDLSQAIVELAALIGGQNNG